MMLNAVDSAAVGRPVASHALPLGEVTLFGAGCSRDVLRVHLPERPGGAHAYARFRQIIRE